MWKPRNSAAAPPRPEAPSGARQLRRQFPVMMLFRRLIAILVLCLGPGAVHAAVYDGPGLTADIYIGFHGTLQPMMRVYLGTIPDYAQGDVAGVQLSGVIGGGPAEQAGLQPHDSILAIDGNPVASDEGLDVVFARQEVTEQAADNKPYRVLKRHEFARQISQRCLYLFCR